MAVLKLMLLVWSINVCLIEKGNAITITKNPNRAVVLTTQNPAGTSFLCQLPSSTTISTIYRIKILRKRDSDSDFSAIAEVKLSDPHNPTILDSDVSTRATVSLGIDTKTKTNSELKLEFVTQQIQCTDVGEYKCVVSYRNWNEHLVTDEAQTTLSVYALPYNISLEAKDSNGLTMVGTASNPKEMNVGETVDFLCSAKIGSYSTTTLRWKVTSQTSPCYTPYNHRTGSYDDGIVTGPSNCTYTRTATMKYKITALDADSQYGLAFQCYVHVLTPTGVYTVPNPPTFHIKAIADSTTQRTTGFSTTTQEIRETTHETTDDNQSKIIIGVASGLVTGLLCFVSGMLIGMICQRRKDRTKASKQGSDYLTPISNPEVSQAASTMELQPGLRELPYNYERLISH